MTRCGFPFYLDACRSSEREPVTAENISLLNVSKQPWDGSMNLLSSKLFLCLFNNDIPEKVEILCDYVTLVIFCNFKALLKGILFLFDLY